MTPKAFPHLTLKRDQNLLREADKVRTVLIIFAGLFLLATPASRLPELGTAWSGLALAAVATLITRFFVNWERLELEGRLHVASALVLMADLAWLTTFVAGTGGFASPFSMLLMVVILFAGIFFTSLPLALPIVTVVVVAYLTLAAAAHGVDESTTWFLGGQLLTAVALGWLCWAMTSVLERERQTNAHVIERLSQGLILLDDVGFLVLANERAEGLLELPLQSLAGRQLAELTSDGQREPLRQVTEEVLAGRREYTLRPVELGGETPRDLRVHTIPCRAGGQTPVGWVVLLEDVTDLQAELRDKEESLAIASHELRSPLATLRAVSHVLVHLGAGLSDEQRAQMLQALATETRRLSDVVAKLMDLNALERETVALESEPVDPRELVTAVAATLWQRAAARLIEVCCEIPSDLPEVAADPTRLRMALGNLAENALKYTPHGGAITFAAESHGQSLCLSVTDTGMGIAPEEHKRIFDRYVRGVAHRGARGAGALEGLGLGLYIARRIAEIHGGTITVHSEVGHGSTFTIELPLNPASAAAPLDLSGNCNPSGERAA